MHPLCLTILAVRYARPHNMPACSRPLGIAGLLLRGSVRVPFLAHAMPLSELLQSEGLSAALVKVAIAAGWSIRNFKHAVDSPAALGKVLPAIFGCSELTSLQVLRYGRLGPVWAHSQHSQQLQASPILQIKVPGLSRSPPR